MRWWQWVVAAGCCIGAAYAGAKWVDAFYDPAPAPAAAYLVGGAALVVAVCVVMRVVNGGGPGFQRMLQRWVQTPLAILSFAINAWVAVASPVPSVRVLSVVGMLLAGWLTALAFRAGWRAAA